MSAEPKCVDLNGYSPHFFDFGAKLAALTQDAELSKNLADAFRVRYRGMLVEAHSNGEPPKYVSKLTLSERAVFDLGRESFARFTRWKYATHERMEAGAPVLAQKRQRQNEAAARAFKTTARKT